LATWGFLSNHAHVLIQIARNPRSTVREIAQSTGITERATISLLHDLRRAGIACAERDGRQNTYWVDMAALQGHPRWAPSDMEIPDQLVEATIRGLKLLASSNGQPAKGRKQTLASPIGGDPDRRWGFLTNHALILIHVAQHPRSTVREIAQAVGITERACHSAIQDLREAGIVDSQREGRRNSYAVNIDHLAGYRREGTAPDLVPTAFVSFLLQALLELRVQA
jgi:DNA-binding IscR family transcriptional regulator